MGLLTDARNFGTLVTAKLKGKPIPWLVDLLITERCNLNCYYCYVDIARRRGEDPNRPSDYPLDELKRIIAELHRCGTRHISLMGGEPLMRKDLADLVAYIKGFGIYVDVFTNGILIHQQLEALKMMDAAMVSLEGREEVHDAERGKNSFKSAVRNLPLLRDVGLPFKINYTITKNNVDELEFIVNLAKEYDATVTIGEATKNYNDEDVVNDNMPSPEQIRRFWEKVRDLVDEGAPILKSTNSIEQLLASGGVITQDEILMPSDPRMEQLKIFPCHFGRYVCQLSPEGIFYPCSKLYGRQGQSIYEHGVIGAFNRMAEQTRCVGCRMSLVCNLNGFLGLDPRTLFETAKSHLSNKGVKVPV